MTNYVDSKRDCRASLRSARNDSLSMLLGGYNEIATSLCSSQWQEGKEIAALVITRS